MQHPNLSAAEVVDGLSGLLGERLKAVYRWGTDFARKPGTSRLLVLVDRLDRLLLDQLAPLAARAQASGIRLRLDTPHDVHRSADTFPVFCLEFRETRQLLRGDDVLGALHVEPGSLRLRVEQGMRALRRDLVHAYLDPERAAPAQLRVTLRQGTHRLAYLLDGLLRLAGDEAEAQRSPADTFQAATRYLGSEDPAVLRRLREFGEFSYDPQGDALLDLYAGTLRALRPLIDAVDGLIAGSAG